MTARNPQSSNKKINSSGTIMFKGSNEQPGNAKTNNIAGICSSCKTEIPFRPGFRVSSLKCPKCNKPIARN